MRARRTVVVAVLAVGVAACGVSVRTDRAAIGGGPEQATAQAEARFRATVSAVSTANPGLGAGQPCDCETANR